ncbi:MAG: ribosome silencing factor [Planctomycetes bacterium]|nr:ribosome silencing factor [Planctomycetota bacterium]
MNEPQKNDASPKKSAKKKSTAAATTRESTTKESSATKSTATASTATANAAKASAASTAAKQEALELAKACAQVAHEKLAEEIAILDVSEILRIADYFVVLSGRNERHVRSIAAELDVKMKARGVKKARIEGAEDGRWALLDFSDVIVHVLEQEARSYYGLERLWADAPRVEWTPEQRSQVAG